MRNKGKMLLFLCSLVLLFLFEKGNVLASEVSGESATYEAIVDDQSDLFTQEEEERILEKMRPITDCSHVAILTRDSNDLTTNKYLENFHKEHWKGQPSVICIYDFGENVVHISRFGDKEAFTEVNDVSLKIIMDEMMIDINNGDFVEASIIYAKRLNRLIHGESQLPICIVTEEGYDVIIDDQAGLLTDDEKEELLPVMQDIGVYGHVVFVTTEENEKNAQQYCRDYFDANWEAGSAVIFLIDMDNRVLRIESFGHGQLYNDISVAYANTITDNVYRYAGDQDYFHCAYTAFSQIYDVLEGKRIAQPMKYISNALLSLILSVFIIFIYVRRRAMQKAPAIDDMLSYIDYYCNVGKVKKVLIKKKRIRSNSNYGSSGSSLGGSAGGYSSSSHSSSSSSSYRSSSSHSSGHSSGSSGSHGGEHRF